MTARNPGLWAVCQAHLWASPKKSALLGVLTVALLWLVVRQVGGGAAQADASPALVPVAQMMTTDAVQPTTSVLPEPLVPLPPMSGALARDPFAVDLELFELAPGLVRQAEQPRAIREHVDPVARALEELTLESTVTGPTPIATVNGTLVRVGDQTHGFEVRRIGARFVVLTHGDREFVLTMD